MSACQNTAWLKSGFQRGCNDPWMIPGDDPWKWDSEGTERLRLWVCSVNGFWSLHEGTGWRGQLWVRCKGPKWQGDWDYDSNNTVPDIVWNMNFDSKLGFDRERSKNDLAVTMGNKEGTHLNISHVACDQLNGSFSATGAERDLSSQRRPVLTRAKDKGAVRVEF